MTAIPIDPERLLAEADFVRRVAGALLYDEHEVEDVVQQTWLAALQRPPREPSALRGWLARVTRNTARNMRRGEGRRRRHEAAAALHAEVATESDVADVLEHEARRREVVEALLALPDPYRRTLLLRWFDGLSPQQIAARTGVPAATVRSQHKRGLALLREHLDRRHGGERERWALGLAALAARPATGVPALATATGVLFAMRGWLVAGVLLLGLVGGGLWLLLGGGGPRHVPPVVDVAARSRDDESGAAITPAKTAAGERAPVDVPAGAAGPSDPAAAAVAASGDSGFRGRLALPDGSAAAGRTVRITGVDAGAVLADAPPLGAGPEQALRLSIGEAVSAADGTFTIGRLASRAHHLLQAGVGEAHAAVLAVARTPAAGEVVDLGTIVLQPRATIRGKVVRPDGAPAAGAEVWAADVPPLILAALPIDRVTPMHGAMLLLPVPTADEIAGAGTNGGQAFAQRARSFLGKDFLRKPGLEPRDGLAVRVLDAPSWWERLARLLPIARTRAAADGTFELGGVWPGGNLLVARQPGFASAVRMRVRAAAGEVKDVGELQLDEGEELAGVILDAGGAKVAGAEVRIAAVGALGWVGLAFSEAPVTTGAGGEFAVPGLPPGKALVAVRRSAADPWHVEGPLVPRAGVELRLPATTSLSLRVTGAASPQLRLWEGGLLGELSRADLQREVPLASHMHATPNEGAGAGEFACRIDALLPGAYTLEVRAAGCAPERRSLVVPSEPVAVRLAPAAPLEVTVVDEHDAPIAGAKVHVQRVATPAWGWPVLPTSYGLPRWNVLPELAGASDAAGRLRTELLPAGRAFVHASHPRFAPASVEVEAPGEAKLVLPRCAVVGGRLLAGNHAADPERWRLVLAQNASFASDEASARSPLAQLQAVPGADGSFRFEGVAPGVHTLQVRPALEPLASFEALAGLVQRNVFSAFDSPPNQQQVVVRAGEERRLDVQVLAKDAERGSGTVSGVVTVDGRPGAGLQLVQPVLFSQKTLATLDQDGSFRLEGMTEGEHRLNVVQVVAGGVSQDLWRGTVAVRTGEEARLVLDLRTGSLRGRAVWPDGSGAAEVVVVARGRLVGGGDSAVYAATNASGDFELPALPAGTYGLVVSDKLAEGGTQGVEVAAGASVGAIVVQVARRAVLRGRVELRGEPPKLLFLTLEAADGSYRRVEGFAGDDFEVTGLVPGVYRVSLRPMDSQKVIMAPASIELAAGVTSVVLTEDGIRR